MMKINTFLEHFTPTRGTMLIGTIFMIGLWFVVINPLNPQLAYITGDLGDSRLSNFLLEHFYRWVAGFDKNFWSAQFFFPYPLIIAFSENFLGSGPFYTIFRWVGLDRETAFQGWYILGYCLNYIAAVFVLSRLGFKSLAVGAGAFLFTFGLPIIAQEDHVQLLYRFGIPLSCYYLWRFFIIPRPQTLASLIFWFVWQFCLSIYTGIFLLFLLIALAIIMPFSVTHQTFKGLFVFWPQNFKLMWEKSTFKERGGSILIILALVSGGLILLWPYYQVTKLYGFSKNWNEVSQLLPTWKSYLLADHSQIWGGFSKIINDIQYRYEHQLFIGIIPIILIIMGLVVRNHNEYKKVVFLHFFAAIVLIGMTISFQGFSIYRMIWDLPGLNGIRAVTRIMMILMWPIALLIAYTFDQLHHLPNRQKILLTGSVYLLLGGLILEPILYNHQVFSKVDAQKRVSDLYNKLPGTLPMNPILIVANNPTDKSYKTDIDAMLLSQDLGWPIYNGYSGSTPPGYGLTDSCRSLPQRILAYMDFSKISNDLYYFAMMNRAVPIGFSDCNPSWFLKKPSLFAGAFLQDLFSGITLSVISIEKSDLGIHAEIEISNHSSFNLPVLSSTDNPFRLSWRWVNKETHAALSGFDERRELDYDINPNDKSVLTIKIVSPKQSGQYQLEVTAVQESIDWFYNRGSPIVKSEQVIIFDNQNNLSINDLALSSKQ